MATLTRIKTGEVVGSTRLTTGADTMNDDKAATKKAALSSSPAREEWASDSGNVKLTRIAQQPAVSTPIAAPVQSKAAEEKPGFLDRVWNTIKGGTKAAASQTSDAMANLYAGGQKQRNAQMLDDLKDVEWDVAMAMRDYDYSVKDYGENSGDATAAKNILNSNLTKLAAYATVLGDGVYDLVLNEARDAANRLGNSEDPTDIYRSLAQFDLSGTTGVQQKAVEATYGMNDELTNAAVQDIESAKQGLGKVGSAAVDFGAGMIPIVAQVAADAVAPGTGSIGRMLTVGGAAGQRYRATAGEDFTPENAAAVTLAAGGGGVAAGKLLSQGIGSLGIKMLKNIGQTTSSGVVTNGANGLMNNVLANIGLGGARAVGYAAGETGVNEITKAVTEDNYTPDWGQIGSSLATSFAFGALTTAVGTIKTTQANKTWMRQYSDALKQRYSIFEHYLQYGTPEQRATAAAKYQTMANQFLNGLDNLHAVGAQGEINEIRSFVWNTMMQMDDVITAGNVYNAGTPVSGTPMIGNGAANVQPMQNADASQVGGEIGLATVGNNVPAPAAEPAAPAAAAQAPVTPVPVPTAPVEAEPIAQQLMAAGADEASAQELAPILSEIISGQEISGNEAAKIAKSEAAVSVLEKTTGAVIDTNAPISTVKTAIKGLASPTEGANAARTGNLPVAAQNAPAAVSAPSGARDAKAAIAEFAGAFGSEGKTALTDNYDGNISPRDYAEAMTRFYNAGAASAKGQSINTEAMMRANTVLSKQQKLAAYRAGIRDTEAAAAKSQATAPAAQQSNEAIWNASNAQLMTADGRSPASYRYETVAVLTDGTALHVFYDSKAKAEAATRNAVGLRGEGTQIVVDLQQPGALEKALNDVTYASGQQRAESEIRVAGSREAAEEARNTAAELERQRVASMNGKEVNTDGENGIVRQGRERNVPQRAGREAGPVSKETAAVREKWAVSGEPKDGERESLSYDEKINPHSLFTEATEGQTVFRDASKTKAVATGHALAEKNGYKAVAWGGGEIRVNDGGTIRGYALISKNEIGAQTDNPEFAYDDLTRHEIMEQKIGHGEIDADTVLDEAAKYVDKAKIDLVVTDVYLKSLGGDGLTGTELEEAIQQARNELVCDGADHINQLRYDVENGNLSGTYVALADLIDEVISGINRAANELTDGAFELEGEASGAEVSTAGSSKDTAFSRKQDVLALKDVDWTEDNTSIKDQLAKHADEINKMQPVAVVEYTHTDGTQLVDLIMGGVSDIGGGLIKRGSITFDFDRKGAASIKGHAKSPEEKAAALAAPYVAKRGKLIAGHRNHEGGGTTTLTYAAPAVINGETVNVGLVVQFTSDGRPHAVNVGLQDNGTFKIDMEKAPKGTNSRVYRYDKGTDLSTMGASADSVTDIPEKSNSKFSAKVTAADTDSAGTSLSEGQRSYFADSKVRDAQGRLKVMYRGGNGDYTVFDRRKSAPSNLYGRGFYFTDSKSHAAQYGKAKPYYLNITNPLTPDQHTITKQQMRTFLEAVAADEDYGLENYGYGATVDSVLQSIYGKGDFEMLQDVNATAIGDLVTAVELFNEVNGTSYDGIIVPTETVAFQSEQIKNTNNLNPTKDKDVRFSRKVDLEESEDLVAVHNLTEKNLSDALDLGGLPMPSIAVVKAKNGHSKYGPISLVFGKDTIDPSVSAANRVYGGDAYTATAPSIGYKIDYDVMKSIREKLHSLLDDETYNTMQLCIDTENLTDKLQRSSGDFKDAYGRESGMKLAFLKDTGRKITVPKKDKAYRADVPILREIIKKFDVLALQEMGYEESKTYEPQIRKMLYDYELATGSQKTAPNGKTFAQMTADNLYGDTLSYGEYTAIIDSAADIKRHGVMRVIDTRRLDSRIDAYFKTKKMQSEYEAWLDNLSKGIIAKKGIRNNADWFTRNGNRRSFEALYDDYTLSNIVKAMKAGQEERGNTFFGANSTILQSVATPSYGSIAEIKADSGRLARYDDESYEAMKKEIDDELFAVINEIYDTTKHWSDNQFIEYDSIAEAMINAARRGGTADAIVRSFKRDGYDISKDIAQQLQGLYKRSADLPTEYFEAKPRRGVGFDEVLAVVAPKNINAELKQRLEDAGISVISYKAGDDADRTKKINSIDGARFSRKITTFEDLRTENRELKDKLAEYQDTARELAKATKQAAYWKGQTQLTKEPSVRQDDVDKLARQIIKGHYSTIKAADISERIKALGDFIVRGHDGDEELTWAGVKDRAVSIARDVIENAEVLAENGMDDFYADIKSRLKNTELLITRRDAEDIADFKYWRRHIPGYMHVKYTDYEFGGNIDQFYTDELQGSYPWLFEDVNGAGGKLERIVEVMHSLEPIYENPYDANIAEAIDACANEIVNGLIDEAVRQVPPTFADKQAKKLAEQKHIDAQRLARVREQKNAAIERIQERNRERTKELLAKARADRDQRLADLKQHYQEVAEAKRERRLDSAARTRLLKIAKRLNNKKLPAVTRDLVQQYIGELDLAAKSMTGATLEKLTDLQAWYAEQAETNPDFISDPSIEKALQRLSKKQIGDLTPNEVADLTNVLLNIENEIRTQRKLIDSQVKHDTYLAGEQVITDIENSKGSSGGVIDKYIWSATLSPTREIHRITGYVDSDPLYVATLELADGQRKMFDYQRRANERFKQWLEDKKFTKTIAGKDAKEITITGIGKNGPTSVTITPSMRMSLYLHSLNDQNLRHIAGGGITVPDIKLYKKGDIVEAYNKGKTIKLTPSEVRRITDGMSEREKAFAKAAYGYFNGQSKEEINATSEKLKGYSVASVDNYFPIVTDPKYRITEFESIKRDGTIEGMGFLKERINAANPIMLYDLNSVLKKSIDQHSKYVGLAIPVRNFSKIWGVTTGSFNDDGSRNNFESSVQKAVAEKWGEPGYQYIEKMMADLSNTPTGYDVYGSLFSKVRSNYAGAVLELNASVAIKQAASYPTAAATVGFGPLLKALGDVSKPDLNLIAKYTPLLWYRSQGYSSQELGELAQRGKSLPKALNWIQAIDVATTTKLWKAAEYYVRANRKDLARGTETYYQEVASVYNSIIEDTQPNYTAMQRPAILRSNNELVRTLNMFKTQPFQNFNILYDGIENLNAKRRAYTNDGSEANKKAYEEAKKKAAWAITSQIVSSFVFALMQYAWDLFRSRDEKYRDKDGDYTVISWMKRMGFNMLTNGFGMFPFGTEALEFFEAVCDQLGEEPLFDATFYGLDVSFAEATNDAAKAILNIVKKTKETIEVTMDSDDQINWESYARDMASAIEDVAKVSGLPVENVTKMAAAIAQQTLKATNGKYVGGYYALRLTSDPTKYSGDYYDLLYKAYSSDKEAYEEVYRLMIESGSFTEDKIKSGMEKRMKDAAGVTKVSELESRYLAPDQQDSYDKGVSALQRSDLWRGATDDAQDAALELLYGLVSGSNAAAAKSARDKIEGGADVGIDQTEFLLYKLALSMTDEPTESGKLGSYTNDEVEEAIRMIPGLTDKERDYLWIAQGKNENKIPKW